MSPSEAQGSGRNTMFMYLGPPVVAALYSRFRPTTLLNPLYFLRFLAFAAGVILILLSGFRSLVVSVSAGFLIASYFRCGARTVVRLCCFGAILIVVLVGMQGTFFQLPRPAQRALSFLPGQWDPVAVVEAQHSTEWRLHMWKTVWTSDRFIKNKLLGDGIGFNAVEMNILSRAGYLLTPEDVQESYMVMGEYHSGPLSTIRDVGIVGLSLFTTLLVVIAREAWSLIRKSRGGPFEFLTLFVGIPLIYEPFGYLVVYGSFKESIAISILSVGMLKMLKNSLVRHDSRSDFPQLTEITGNTNRHRRSLNAGSVLTSKAIHP